MDTFSGIPLSASSLLFGNNFTVVLSRHGNTYFIVGMDPGEHGPDTTCP